MLRANGTPKGTVPLNVGDAVFLKTICCGWLHGTVVSLTPASVCLAPVSPASGVSTIRTSLRREKPRRRENCTINPAT